MLKMVGFLKRKPGMSKQDFVAYYESTHARIGERYLTGAATKYFRRYLEPISDAQTGLATEPEYDVVMEIWFADRERWQSTMAALTEPDVAQLIREDEERLFDRSRMRFYTVEEHESVV